MAAVLELQQQLQDHGHQLAQLSQQLQNMESLLRSHEEPFQASFKTPRTSRTSRSPLSASPERKGGAQSCTTEIEIAQARWEALVNMIELEEQARSRDVAELKKLIEQSKEKSEEKTQNRLDHFELQLADLRKDFEGFVKQIKGKLALQEDAIKDFTFRSEFEGTKAKQEAFATAINEMPKMPAKLELYRDTPEVFKAENAVAVPADSEGCRLSQTLAHAQSEDTLSDSAKRRTTSSSPISRNAYARLGAGGGKSHTINIIQDPKTPVLPKRPPVAAPVAHVAPVPSVAPIPSVAPVPSVAPMPCLARECTTGSLVEAKFERMVEPPRIMTAARLSPPMTYRSVRTPVKGNLMPKQDYGFVMPSPPAPNVRFASPAPFSRPLKESELLLGTPTQIRSL